MEFLRIFIANPSDFLRLGGRDGFVGLPSDGLTVAVGDDGALQVGAVDSYLRIGQAGQDGAPATSSARHVPHPMPMSISWLAAHSAT